MKFLKTFFKHPWIIIASCIALTLGTSVFIKDLTLDNSTRMFFPQKDASYQRLIETEDTFGSMLAIGLTLEAKDGTILTPEYIDVVRKITDRVLTLKDVESLDSLTHIDYVCADETGAISATQLIPDTYTGSPEDIMQLASRLTEWSDMYNRVIINDDNTATQFMISLTTVSEEMQAVDEAKAAYDAAAEEAKTNPSDETKAAAKAAKSHWKKLNRALKPDSVRQQRVLEDIRAIAQEEIKGHNLIMKLVGEPVLSESSRDFMLSDLVKLIPLVVVVVLASLYLSFKSVTGTLLPLSTVLMSTAMTCGLMGLFGYTFTLVSSV
ncbi:MAG: MMPL family transporter, partial [Treponema sp.]|nr:MMPL family transporter [Candidatus Treponema equi]